jgi:hypothetical protein
MSLDCVMNNFAVVIADYSGNSETIGTTIPSQFVALHSGTHWNAKFREGVRILAVIIPVVPLRRVKCEQSRPRS